MTRIEEQLEQLSARHASALQRLIELENSTSEKMEQLSQRHAAGLRKLNEMEHLVNDQLRQLWIATRRH